MRPTKVKGLICFIISTVLAWNCWLTHRHPYISTHIAGLNISVYMCLLSMYPSLWRDGYRPRHIARTAKTGNSMIFAIPLILNKTNCFLAPAGWLSTPLGRREAVLKCLHEKKCEWKGVQVEEDECVGRKSGKTPHNTQESGKFTGMSPKSFEP